jgi:hypothetical protein
MEPANSGAALKKSRKEIIRTPRSSLSLSANTLVVRSSLSLLLPSTNLKLLGVADRRNPANGVPSTGNLGIKLINLFERKTLGLINAGVNKHTTYKAEATPDEEHLRLEIGVTGAAVHHVRGSVGNSPVEQPVGGGGDGETLRPSLKWEEFTCHDPGDRTPRTGEEEDVNTHEGDEDFVRHIIVDGCAHDRDDQLADTHAHSTEHEKRTTTPFLDHVETGEGGNDVDNVSDQGDHEGVSNSRVLEECCAVVDYGFG